MFVSSLVMPWILLSVVSDTTRPKSSKAFGGAGVLEIIEDDPGGTYRAVYTIKFKEAVFVLHVFQKKSKSGIATPKPDLDIIRERLKVAAKLSLEMRDE